MKDKIIEQIISFILIGILTFVINSFINYTLSEKGTIRVGSSIRIENEKYELPIEVYNFENTSINNIGIIINDNIDISNIRTSGALDIIKKENAVNSENSSFFEITTIAEKQKIRIVFLTNRNIESSDISIIKNGNKLVVEYPDDVVSPFGSQLKSLLFTTFIYIVILGTFDYFTAKRNKRILAEAQQSNLNIKESIEIQDKLIKELKNNSEQLQKEIKDTKYYFKKREIILLAKIRDYSKELSFWRDTIRALLYKSSKNTINDEVIINTVTKGLKTYQTLSTTDHDFESLKILSGMLKDELNDNVSHKGI